MKHRKNKRLIGSIFLVATLPFFSVISIANENLYKNEDGYKNGEHVYNAICSHCHTLGNGPKLKGRNLPPAYIKSMVRNGFRAMPAFRASYINDKSLELVAEYISKSSEDKVKE
jgi:mono/diheme cytochrome c family protein